MSDIKYWLALRYASNIGSKRLLQLVDKFGSPSKVLNAILEELISIRGIGKKIAESILQAKENIDNIEGELSYLNEQGIKVISIADENYPPSLKDIEDPPAILFIKGRMEDSNRYSLAIVGSRDATAQGYRMAYNLARKLAERGFTIVSGFASGIDTAAHKGALDSGGKTWAVLGSGINFIYPRENLKMVERICCNGAFISEQLPQTPPNPGALMARDRIVSGLSQGVIVVESGEQGGSMDTAQRAIAQRKPLFAVRWKDVREQAKGNELLIEARDATPIEDISDIDRIIEELK